MPVAEATTENLAVGCEVFLKTDPRCDVGVVARVEGNRYFVLWKRTGRTWIYAASDLILVTP